MVVYDFNSNESIKSKEKMYMECNLLSSLSSFALGRNIFVSNN